MLFQKRLVVAAGFTAGFFAVFMKTMIAVFGRNRIMPILMTDYITNMETALRSVFRFLKMSKIIKQINEFF